MSVRFNLRLRAQPALRVELAGLTPLAAAAAAGDAAELSRTTVWHGNERLALGELFDVAASAAEVPTLVFEGDLARFDGIGRGMDGGGIRVEGDAGDYVGAQMRAGEIHVAGDAGLLAACEMAGGRLEIDGAVGDYAAAALPGSMDGMRGGMLVVRGNAGARFGDRMRRGMAVIHGDAGDFLASRMVAGTIALAGRCGAHCGYGMQRGTLVFAGAAPEVPTTFVPTTHDIRVFWALLARSLAYHGGPAGGAGASPFAGLAARMPRRFVGDLAADGKGEWLVAAHTPSG